MFYLYILILFNLINCILTVPTSQIVFQLDQKYNLQEYDLYSSLLEHYEDLIDSVTSTETEIILTHLIDLPHDLKRDLYYTQAKFIGLNKISDKQYKAMPSIIGKHIQMLNKLLYQSIEIDLEGYWKTCWNRRLFDKEDTSLIEFLSYLNLEIQERLLDDLESYDLIGKVKDELMMIFDFDWLERIKYWFYPVVFIDHDFLSTYLIQLETSLLNAIEDSFIPFYLKIKSDIIKHKINIES